MTEKGEEMHFVKWFSELNNKDISIAGGKGASLAEMYNNKFPIPPGFIITAQAYKYFIDKSGVGEQIKGILSNLDVEDTTKLNKTSQKIRAIIENASMPKEMQENIIEAYDILDANKNHLEGAKAGALSILKNSFESPFVAVRSSATTEDLADASFAGQQESFLNVKGHQELISKIKECFSSLFTARAIYYRVKKGFGNDKSYLAVVIQKMINSDKSGVIFSKNPVSSEDTILIEAVWGLGEGIVSGRIKPDHYVVSGNLNNFEVKEIKVSEKKVAIVRDSSGENKIVDLTEERSKQQVLTTYDIKRLANYSKKLEEHYKKPQDIEFAISDNEVYIVQSRPVTTKFSEDKKKASGEVLLSGLGASPGIASGVVKIIRDLKDLDRIQKGDVLVTEMTNPDMVVSMQKASGIITDEGGVTSHAAIVSREMGIPAVVGTGDATKKLIDGQNVTVDGNTGRVLEGKGENKVIEIKPVVPTRTKIKVILDLPDFAKRAAQSGVAGVGLVRLEGIIAGSGKHPLIFVKQNRIHDYSSIIEKGLRKIAEYFNEMWIRTSDIRSDEFRNLEGAPQKMEGNPMLGDHGIRFSLRNKEILQGEIEAIKKIAKDLPNKSFGIMIPQVISVEELRETKKIANQIGMTKNIRIGIMVETPAAVQIINSLCEEGIDFISFGTNDLTQYTLAIDRNNEQVQYLYNEMNPAILNSISYVIRRCKRYGVETSICGQAGSKEEMVRFLVSEGIDSISVNADAAEKLSLIISELEKNKKSMPTSGQIEVMEIPHEKKKEKEQHKEIPVQYPKRRNKNEQDRDIEEVILSQLDEDYVPGDVNGDKDVPNLNDAIPVGSEMLNENEEKEEDLENDLTKELGLD